MELSRKCPSCNNIIYYKRKQNLILAIKKNTECITCSANKRNKCVEKRKNISKKFSGINNPMYGKTIYDIWTEKYGLEESNILKEKHRKNSIDNNAKGMTGISVYEIWVSKYGKIESDKKLEEFKKKISDKNKGNLNPMFGKPSPKGSGNGWSGYFKNIYFRSILELSYIFYLIDNNISFISGESNKFKIQYIINNTKKNYYPDFIVDNKIIEIKPSALINTNINIAKFKAAKEKFGDNFQIVTEKEIHLDTERIILEYKNGNIKFTKTTEKKFLRKYGKLCQ